jgi:alpha-beta hydrolase superfamily lysophospholipase
MQMRGYFFPALRDSPRPGLLFVIGADTTPEEAYFFGINEAQARGISCLVFNGPGQAASLIEDGIPTRPDYEKPISAGLDYLATRREVDPNRMGLIGHSLGGYYAARGAAYDSRVNACVIWGACFNVLRDYFDFHPPSITRCMRLVGATTEDQAREKLKHFNLDEAAKKIRCPILILHGEEDAIVSPDAARQLYREVSCPKELKMFSAAEGGSWHCQHNGPTAAQAYVYDWLADTL